MNRPIIYDLVIEDISTAELTNRISKEKIKYKANEYVSACVVGTIQCKLPGKSSSGYDDGIDTYEDSDGMWHGLCGNNASITFNGDTGSGYEVLNN